MASKYNYQLTPLAEQDVDSALAYITETLCNGQAAGKLLEDIESAIATICEFPYSSADCKLFLVQNENIRHILVDNYVLVYEVKEAERQINLLRFRYTRMDLTKLGIDKRKED